MKITVPKAAVVTAFNTAFASMKVHLDTYGSKHGTSWYKNSSYLLLPTGAKTTIPIGEYKTSITKRRQLKHYLDEMDSSSIQATIEGKYIRIDVHFESQGEEIKTKCVHKPFRKWKECSLKMERDIHLNNTILSIWLAPAAHKGSISYASPKVALKTDVKIASKLCQAFKGICGKIEGTIQKKLTSAVANSARAKLSSSAMKQLVANKVKSAPGLRGYLKDYKVLKVASKGSNFIVTVKD